LRRSKSSPNRHVGIVTFNSEVQVLGDCGSESKTIAGDRLTDYDFITQQAADPALVRKEKREREERESERVRKRGER
jgi:hypothetical protein